jgi:hypothetical protein
MTTGPTDGRVTTLAGGPDGMPLVLPLERGVRPHFAENKGARTFCGKSRAPGEQYLPAAG